MKKLLFGLACLVAVGLSQLAHATLIDRGNGLIYDDSTNLTWMQDANYAKTSGYTGTGVDAYGRMNWFAAKIWAANLSFGGYDDWRLPTTNPQQAGLGLTESELGHMFFVNLHNKGACDPNLSCFGTPVLGAGFLNKGPFSFTDATIFWTETPVYGQYDEAWVFSAYLGFQGTSNKGEGYYQTWAVRDGDVASVPEPASIALVGLGLLSLAVVRRKSARQKAA